MYNLKPTKAMETKPDFSPIPCGVRKNVIIIGGGVTGTLSAFELARAGHNVTLIEAKTLGNGSSSRSAACIRQQFVTPSTVKGMIYCTAFYKNWSQVVGGNISPISTNGYLFLKDWNTNMDDVHSIIEMQHRAGLSDVRFLNASELNEMFPYLETTGLIGATWCLTDGFLDPCIVYMDAASGASTHGATIIQNDAVISVEFDGDKPIGVRTKSGQIFYADIFVDAAGVWSPKISSLFNGYYLDIKARRRYLYFLDGFKNGIGGNFLKLNDFHNLPMIITPRGCYCRPESKAGYQLMMGWLHPTKPLRPTFSGQDEIEEGFRVNNLSSFGEALRKEIATYIPDAAAGEKMGKLFSVTSGFYEDTPDHNPFIGFDPWVSNLIHVTGFSGHGLMQAPFSALLVSHLIRAGKDFENVQLPLDLGIVDVKTFHIEREFKQCESMVI